jgi:hypothetical protein
MSCLRNEILSSSVAMSTQNIGLLSKISEPPLKNNTVPIHNFYVTIVLQ